MDHLRHWLDPEALLKGGPFAWRGGGFASLCWVCFFWRGLLLARACPAAAPRAGGPSSQPAQAQTLSAAPWVERPQQARA